MFSHMKYGGQSAAALRRRSLERNFQHWSLLSHTSICLTCLQRNWEHHPECGHGICDDCLTAFGKPKRGVEYHYDLVTCPFCQREVHFQARRLPPTCRVRFVGFDGGGSRGIVSLGFIEKLDKTLDLSYPLQEHFDYGIGTSSGKADFAIWLWANDKQAALQLLVSLLNTGPQSNVSASFLSLRGSSSHQSAVASIQSVLYSDASSPYISQMASTMQLF
jgi:hypothetical protein